MAPVEQAAPNLLPPPGPTVDPLSGPDPFPDPEWNPPPFPTGMVEEDGEPMESLRHRLNINLLTESIECHFRHRQDFFVGGNMFLYFSGEQVRTLDYRGPDFFFVADVPHGPIRPYWAIWENGGRYPDVIIELLSPSTRNEELSTKKDLYDKTFKTPDYYCFDPDAREFLGWTRVQGHYEPLTPGEGGRFWSNELQLWVGPWEGTYQNQNTIWLRFFHPDGRLVFTFAEAAEQRADAEKQRADAEKQRADALAAELAQLKAQLQN